MARRRAAPPHLAYATPPLRLRLGTRSTRLGEAVVDAMATAVIHDFGAVTIAFRMPLDCEIAALPALTALSYYPDDLAVTEWNVALIVDPDYTDAVNVLEYLNVQLVELRYYDALLDRRVAATYGIAATRARAVPLLHRRYQQAIAELAAIRVRCCDRIRPGAQRPQA